MISEEVDRHLRDLRFSGYDEAADLIERPQRCIEELEEELQERIRAMQEDDK